MPQASTGTEQAGSFSSPHEEALLTLMRSSDCLHRALQLRLRPYGLTSTQYNVLRILRGARPTGLTCSEIGSRMITPEPDITRLLARLKLHKLVSQQRDRRDKRVLWTHISDPGLELLSRLDGVIDQAPKELLHRLDLKEVKNLTILLNKALCCGQNQPDSPIHPDAAKLPVTGKPPLPHSRISSPRLRHHPE